jgi:hypothetical protein
MRITILVLLSAGVLPAQLFTIGVKAGVPLSDDRSGDSVSESKPYTVGPAASFGLPRGFRLEFDALYRRVGYRTHQIDIVDDLINSRAHGNSWEFPIILRRALYHGIYAGAGYAPRVINGRVHEEGSFVTSLVPFQRTFRQSDGPGQWETTHGLVVTGGIEKRLGKIRVSPEIRYTRWNQPSVNVGGSHLQLVLGSQNQVDAMLGVSF